MKRLHVVGCHRSGTTLMFELLAACYEHGGRCQHEQTVFRPPQDPDAGLYLSKKPSDITHIRHVFLGDDDLYLIYLLRDPRAVVTSVHPSKPNVYFSSFERWRRYERAAATLKRHPRFLEIRYEALVRDPDRVQADIEARFPFLERRHRFSEFGSDLSHASEPAIVSLGGIRPIGTASIDNWKRHLPRVKYQLRRHPELADALTAYGYEADHSWLELVADVEELAQAYGEGTPPVWKRWERDLRYWRKSRRYLRLRMTSRRT